MKWGIGKLLLVNRAGILWAGRNDLNPVQEQLAALTNPESRRGMLADALAGADIFIGVSGPGVLTYDESKPPLP